MTEHWPPVFSNKNGREGDLWEPDEIGECPWARGHCRKCGAKFFQIAHEDFAVFVIEGGQPDSDGLGGECRCGIQIRFEPDMGT